MADNQYKGRFYKSIVDSCMFELKTTTTTTTSYVNGATKKGDPL